MRRCLPLLLALLFALPSVAAPTTVPWLRDDAAAFEKARAEKRFVLLYLEAVWCHWCHVMDHDTYADPAVVAAIERDYVPLRIDHDARPDFAARYRAWGWPATVVYAADGTEIVKRRGYIAPAAMTRLLAAIVRDPSPEELAEETTPAPLASELGAELREQLATRHRLTHDVERGGLRSGQKFLDRDSVEYDLTLALSGDAAARARAVRTLDAARALIDPVWGGVYQYSTHGDWVHPHFEKLGWLQADYLRVYALGYAVTGDVRYRQAVASIRRYVTEFLRAPDGGYYASQDADLKPGEHAADYFARDDRGRRALGVPRVDRHRYARDAGAHAEALGYWYEVSGDTSALAEARAALEWVERERALAPGYRHDVVDTAGPFLADQLAVARGQLQLYRVTGERAWLERAARTTDYVGERLRAPAGYASAVATGSPIAPAPQVDENIALARHANLLARYAGSSAHGAMARHALSYLARRDVALARLTEAGVLLADHELARDPLHVTVIGPKHDLAARILFEAALRLPAGYKRLDWWDRSEGPLANLDVDYPTLKRAALFVCTDRRCSTPILTPADLELFLAEAAANP
jgi:hypothetical protein